jgi:hypothetical protein
MIWAERLAYPCEDLRGRKCQLSSLHTGRHLRALGANVTGRDGPREHAAARCPDVSDGSGTPRCSPGLPARWCGCAAPPRTAPPALPLMQRYETDELGDRARRRFSEPWISSCSGIVLRPEQESRYLGKAAFSLRSRASCAIGLPVSRTSRTAPSRESPVELPPRLSHRRTPLP